MGGVSGEEVGISEQFAKTKQARCVTDEPAQGSQLGSPNPEAGRAGSGCARPLARQRQKPFYGDLAKAAVDTDTYPLTPKYTHIAWRCQGSTTTDKEKSEGLLIPLAEVKCPRGKTPTFKHSGAPGNGLLPI